MFAVAEFGGKQFMVRENDILRVDRISTPEGATAKEAKVFLVASGSSAKIGTPYLAGAAVEFTVLKSGFDKKVRTFKMKAKKRYKRLRGYRPPFTDLKILKIHG